MRVWKPEAGKMEESSKKRKASEDKATRKKARAEEKARIMAELPKVDEHGISYTKQQLRRMRKRVARGLDPIETPAEENERKARESQLKKEEEAELAGLILNSCSKEEVEEEEPPEQEGQAHEEFSKKQQENPTVDSPSDQEDQPRNSATKKRHKQVPFDYVCSACQNAIEPAHWIYDCPRKKTVRGTNQKSKKLRGLHDPSDNKVFVSGLSFETTVASVKALFSSKSGITPSFVKLVKFKDSARCRGQAYVSFKSSSETNQARQLDGVMITNNTSKKDLKLSVSKVLNRSITTKHTSK